MIFSEDIKSAVSKCIEWKIPFVVYCKPKASAVEFFSNPSRTIGLKVTNDSNEGFAVSLFNSSQQPYLIYPECDTAHTLTISDYNSPSDVGPWDCSSNKEEYLTRVQDLINRLKSRGGKTVYSKVVTGKSEGISWVNVIYDYFSIFQSTFRYAYYLPETGFWLGASPEILLEGKRYSDKISTMSLAGTRKTTNQGEPWDLKNKEEHDIVTNYIVYTLQQLGIGASVSAYENVTYGSIEHLCNRIIGIKTSPIDLFDIANKLSPTPALAGFPLSDALNDIVDLEPHPRHCYGGYIAINNNDGFYAYVNLRCVHFNHTNYCIYGGGGITAKSDAIEEWNETEAKIAQLRKLIEK